jgi:hypothetical protein
VVREFKADIQYSSWCNDGTLNNSDNHQESWSSFGLYSQPLSVPIRNAAAGCSLDFQKNNEAGIYSSTVQIYPVDQLFAINGCVEH